MSSTDLILLMAARCNQSARSVGSGNRCCWPQQSEPHSECSPLGRAQATADRINIVCSVASHLGQVAHPIVMGLIAVPCVGDPCDPVTLHGGY